jgi:hypothetical protein
MGDLPFVVGGTDVYVSCPFADFLTQRLRQTGLSLRILSRANGRQKGENPVINSKGGGREAVALVLLNMVTPEYITKAEDKIRRWLPEEKKYFTKLLGLPKIVRSS